MSLKPNEEIMAGSFAIAAVIGIFQMEAPNFADVKAAPSNNPTVHKSIKTAVLTSAAVVSGVALLSKSPAVYVMGGVTIAILGWTGYHANAVSAHTGKPTTQVNS